MAIHADPGVSDYAAEEKVGTHIIGNAESLKHLRVPQYAEAECRCDEISPDDPIDVQRL